MARLSLDRTALTLRLSSAQLAFDQAEFADRAASTAATRLRIASCRVLYRLSLRALRSAIRASR